MTAAPKTEPKFHARSLTELLALRTATQPDDSAVHTGAAEFGDELQTLTYSDISRAVDRLSAHYAGLNLQPSCTPGQLPPPRVIAVLVTTAIDESLLEMALARLGLTALLVSVNNSVAAVAHLCKITKANHIIYGPKFASTVAQAQSLLSKEGISLQLVKDKRFPLWGPGGVREAEIAPFPARLTPEEESKRACVILHSSGSTGFPKPVYVTHYGLIANAAVSVPKTGFSALPLFHGFGHFSIFRCIYHGKAFTLFPPHLPITAGNIVRVINASPTRPVQHFAVPYVLKLLAETQEGVASLARMEAVSFAGAAVPDDLGDRLVAAGVPLFSQYGTTETGALMTSNRDFKTDKAWNYVRNEGLISNYLDLEPRGSNTFEVVVKDGWPAKIMSNRPDGAYATKDLVVRHPDHPTWLKYVGRLDDTLTLTLGEKTNPAPLELDIRGNSPLVQECIVFGDGRPQVGALILPSDAGAALAHDRAAFIDAIWPVIADANSRAPTHSRILPEMVEILPPGTDIPVATKMSILRPACYRKFADVIDGVYVRFEQGTGLPKRDITNQEEMEAFLSDTLRVTLGEVEGLERDTDLFAFGVDSLQATRVRNALQKDLELGGATLGQNIVYDHPSIAQLAEHLLAVKAGNVSQARDVHVAMKEMVERWATAVDPVVPSSGPVVKEHVVLLTGATGSLGAHILDQLLRRPEVVEVVCIARAPSHAQATTRVEASLAQRHRTVPARWRALAADVNRPDLGLSADEYDSLRTSVTEVIHNAWPVNFVLSLESFNEHIGGAVNLLNLARRTTHNAAFFFSSSVGTRQGDGLSFVPETFPDDPASASGMGYAQSKWVVEKVLERAGGRVGVLRIGQLVGDTEHGVWNETEAWPLMFRTARVTNSLPLLEETPAWLPVDVAARAISEIVLAHTASAVYHVVNPHIAEWSTILDGLAAGGLVFDRVPPQEWITALEGYPDLKTNPSYKLLGFWKGRLGARRLVEFSVEHTSRISPTIAGCEPVGPELVKLWVDAWRESGFL
ncbi:uncharacterized protein CcaverHIS019_0400320 [Cutaneotrichosporon cavernicola]|uniref:Carrier domain-containing protein n=1 Tax=Cutaneotrichosporon cavernicola TaxID=279322 RepID=A0AA48L3D1_9TREE|nr:uncharacterized protein CcaverHIS019_0400320 [Cutaneotrichosporon cavernicola]BEI91212.1 hypothetical protein CcaverHIS019_0400320 [Cutaneotrichosporon cavernicola]BEI98985.1 hypothetical protein CcaverHIS631_0400280 [Cutaneotrichosporon cavernicola]BEJ06759.1 hypothetical protein CcaverHIS641_0400280 [Cutaneotrichosporon cavernicola]